MWKGILRKRGEEVKEILIIFGKRLKAMRKGRKMTQEELADKLGLHNSYIGLLERGERIPSLLTLDRIAKYFGVKPADLIMDEPKHQRYDLKQKELLYIVNEGSPEDLDKLYKMAKIVLEAGSRKK